MSATNDPVWFCASPEGNRGPFTHEQMMDFVQRGQLQPDTPVWREGLASWTRAADAGFAAGGPIQPGAAPLQAAPAPAAQVPAAPTHDDKLDAVFVGLVKESWKKYRKREVATQVDEVLLGAVIAATLDNGFVLIDINSSGANHYLRFEQPESAARIIFKLSHHAESLLTAQVLGHEASVTIGYGERVRDFGPVWNAIKQEMKGGYVSEPDPGIISVDGDISSQYIYVEVGLLWDINDYLNPADPYEVNYPKLTEHIGATVHALRKYLYGRLGGGR